MSDLPKRLRAWAAELLSWSDDPDMCVDVKDRSADLLAAAEALEKETKRLEWLMVHSLAYVWRGNPPHSVELTFNNRAELDKAIKEETGFND